MARRSLAATLSVVRIINLRAIRRHTLRALLAAISLGGGVAIVVAVMIETSSVRAAIDDVGYRIAGPTPLRIVGEATLGGIDPAVLDTARKVPGVSVLVPVIRAVTLVRDGDRETTVLALGIDCSAQWIIDPKVCQAGQKEPLILATSTTLGKTLGSSATLATDVGQLSMPRLQQVPQLDTVNNGRVVLLPLSAAKARFARSDWVDTVYVKVANNASASEVQARLVNALGALGPGFRVLTRNDPAAGFNVNTILFPMLAIFALIAVGVGVILIAQLTRLSVEERRREIAIAAALGASPVSVLSGFLAEAAMLGAAGSVVGILVGIVIAHPVVASASELTQRFMGVNVPVVVETGVVVVGLGTGVLLAVLAAIIPSLSASNTAIATELSGRAAHEDSTSRSIWRKAAALLAIGFAGVAVARLATISGRPRALAGGVRQWRGRYRSSWIAFGRSISERAAHRVDPAPAGPNARCNAGHRAHRIARRRITDNRDRGRCRGARGGRDAAIRIPGRHRSGVANVAQAQADGACGGHHHAIYRLGVDGRQIFPRYRREAFFLPGVDTVEQAGGNRDDPSEWIIGLRSSRGSTDLFFPRARRASPKGEH